MTLITVYFAPGTCSRVPMIALEQAGVHYESRVIAFNANEHRSEEFLKINPAGKVPALVIDDDVLSENIAIATFLDRRFPEAKLLPQTKNEIDRAQILADLSFCSSVLHPFVTRIRLPHYFCSLDNTQANVWELAAKGLELHFQRIEQRFAGSGPWWYGDQWSSVDTYINWVWFRVTGAGFPSDKYPNFAAHNVRMSELPAYKCVMEREAIGQAELETRGLSFSFKPENKSQTVKEDVS